MESIVLNSGLDGFVLLDAITESGSEAITGYKRFTGAPVHLGIESLAQLGALHVRILTDFEKHAFLLSIKRCSMRDGQELNGCLRLSGDLISRSTSAFSYRLRAMGDGGETVIEGEFLFAVVDYDDNGFKRDALREHYQRVFSCLKHGSKADC